MAREALWPCWAGMWLSSFVLLPIGIFLTYKAATDAALLNPEAWLKVWERSVVRAKRLARKVRCKKRPSKSPLKGDVDIPPYDLKQRLERFVYLGDDRQIMHRFCQGKEILF